MGCDGGAVCRGVPKADDCSCAALLFAFIEGFFDSCGGRRCCVEEPKPGTLEAFCPALLFALGFGGSGAMAGGNGYTRGVPNAEDCICAAVLAGVGGGGARAHDDAGEGARGVLSPNTEDCCCASLLFGLTDVALPAAGGGGAYSRGVPKADDCCCALVLFGIGGACGFGGFGGAE